MDKRTYLTLDEVKRYLHILFKRFTSRVNYFVIAKDQFHLVNFSKPNTIIICNTGESTSDKVNHWVALYFKRIGYCLYLNVFDSFGKPLSHYKISLPVKPVLVNSNRKSIQDPNADSCGLYCIYFVYNMFLGKGFNSIINNFSSRVTVNEQKIKSFFSHVKNVVKQ